MTNTNQQTQPDQRHGHAACQQVKNCPRLRFEDE